MRQQNKLLILIISIFFLFSIQIIAFSPIPVVGNSDGYIEIIGGQTIRYDWLTFEMAEDNNEYMKHNMGGLDLFGYESLGSTEAGENTLCFTSKVEFGYEMNSYLSLDMDNVFPELDTDKMSGFVQYAHIREFPLYIIFTKDYYGKFRYSYVDLGEHVDHDYDLTLPVTIGINPTFSALDGETINGITVKTSEYLHEVKSMKVVLAREGTCGDYNDIYTSQEESGGVETTTLSDDMPTFSQQTVIDHLKELDLGYKTGMTSEYLFPKTIQEWVVDTFAVGEDETNHGTGDLTYNYPIRLQPEITSTRQRIDVRKTFFSYNPLGIVYTEPIVKFSVDRIISAHIKCPFVHTEYETTVYLVCNVELDAEMYESALDDPFFRKGDWIWDPIIESWDPVVVVMPTPFDDLEGWWNEYGWIIITVIVLVAGIYLFIQIGLPLILKKQAMDVLRGR